MSGPLKVQIAFQGGGARAAALLAAVEAIEEAERNKKITVTRISGTSAGALAAVVLAAGIPAERVRRRLLETRDTGLSALFPPLNLSTQLWRVYRGKPFYNEKTLKDLLLKLLDAEEHRPKLTHPELLAAGANVGSRQRLKPTKPQERGIDKDTTFQELLQDGGKPCFVTVTHLSKGHVVDRPGEGPAAIQSLANSCGLPFVFRTYKDMNGDNPTLDGGLCENLPTDVLDDPQDHGDVFAISFKSSGLEVPHGAKDLLMKLFDVMISHGVTRSLSRLGSSAVSLVPTKLTTFDFGKICANGLADEDYAEARNSVTRDIDKWLEARRAEKKPLTVADTFEHVSAMFDALKTDYRIIRALLLVVGRSFARGMGDAEEVLSVTEFEPENGPLRVYREYLGSSNNLNDAEWSAFEVDGNGKTVRIPCIKIPLPPEDPDSDHPLSARQLATEAGLLFTQELKPGKRYRLMAKSQVRGALEPLRKVGGTDFVANTLKRPTQLVRPDSLLDVLLAMPSDMRLDARPQTGRELAEAEVSEFLGMVPAGFRLVGWRREGPKQGDSLHISLTRVD
jgi:predicted acylesterase/phospholipase RssA